MIQEANGKKEFVDNYLQSKIKDFPIVAGAIADLETAIDKKTEDLLLHKPRKAVKASIELAKIRETKRILIAENKALKWEMKYIRNLLPWLDELEDTSIEPQIDYFNTDSVNEYDEASYWLTPNEYQQLSTVEKNQLALDRYKKRRKDKVEIGYEYERYIGYYMQQKGYEVQYYGIEQGKEDLGRDLICKKEDQVLIVQCKCWSNKRKMVIHEKHINQLFGTTLKYYYDNVSADLSDFFVPYEFTDTKINVVPVFVSTVPLSDTAEQFAAALNVEFWQIPLGDYPVIKCNINQGTKEKIYHLPFDQQYDKCIINQPGEFYATTVAEAENAGFRRARRWLG